MPEFVAARVALLLMIIAKYQNTGGSIQAWYTYVP